MEEKIGRMMVCLETGETVKIRYNAGSQPGTVREIYPLSINDEKGLVVAKCLTSNKKTVSFFIDKLDIVGDDMPVTYKLVKPVRYKDIDDFIERQGENIKNMGYLIKAGDDSIYISKMFKNKRLHIAGISYKEYTDDYYDSGFAYRIDDDYFELSASADVPDEIKSQYKNPRPWNVSLLTANSYLMHKYFGRLEKAIECLLGHIMDNKQFEIEAQYNSRSKKRSYMIIAKNEEEAIKRLKDKGYKIFNIEEITNNI